MCLAEDMRAGFTVFGAILIILGLVIPFIPVTSTYDESPRRVQISINKYGGLIYL
jgi:uncharacterized membrane protein